MAGRLGFVRLAEAGALAAIALMSLGVYVWAHGGSLDPPSYLDPWIYTASMWNSGFIYHFYGSTYYPARLPWIIPGYLLNLVLSHQAAFYVQHTLFALAGALAAWYLIRTFYGRVSALAVFALVSTSLLYYNAFSTDYPDGAQITFLLLGASAALTSIGARRRLLRLGVAGFFLAAAVATNLVASVYVVGIVGCYLIVRFPRPAWRSVRELATDSLPAVGGAVVLVIACGSFAVAKGAEFLFFMPQWREISSIKGSAYHHPFSSWVPREPRVLIPFGLLFVIAILWWPLKTRWNEVAVRFAAGCWLFLAFVTAADYLWQFAGGGYFVETSYYFTVLTAVFALNFGTVIHLALGSWDRSDARLGLVAATLIAGAAPTVVIYAAGGDRLVGTKGMWISVTLFCSVILGGIALALGLAHSRFLVSAALVLILAFTVNFASASSLTSQSAFMANRDVAGYFVIAGRFLDFMRSHHLQDSPPAFWSRNESVQTSAGLQSLYLYGFSATSFDMPVVDSTFRTRIAELLPKVLVLICARADCNGGPGALVKAGYKIHERAHTRLASGRWRFWIRAFDLQLSAGAYYAGLASAPAISHSAPTFRTWAFRAGLPRGWVQAPGVTLSRSSKGLLVTPFAKPWDYTLVSPTLDLQPGQYRVVLSGQVVRGGLDLGILNLDSNQWLAQTFYWYGQHIRRGHAMQTSVDIKSPTPVHIVLSNWMPTSGPLAWRVERIQVSRQNHR